MGEANGLIALWVSWCLANFFSTHGASFHEPCFRQ